MRFFLTAVQWWLLVQPVDHFCLYQREKNRKSQLLIEGDGSSHWDEIVIGLAIAGVLQCYLEQVADFE